MAVVGVMQREERNAKPCSRTLTLCLIHHCLVSIEPHELHDESIRQYRRRPAQRSTGAIQNPSDPSGKGDVDRGHPISGKAKSLPLDGNRVDLAVEIEISGQNTHCRRRLFSLEEAGDDRTGNHAAKTSRTATNLGTRVNASALAGRFEPQTRRLHARVRLFMELMRRRMRSPMRMSVRNCRLRRVAIPGSKCIA